MVRRSKGKSEGLPAGVRRAAASRLTPHASYAPRRASRPRLLAPACARRYNRPGYVLAMARLVEEQLLSATFLPPAQAAAIAAGDEAAKAAARPLASAPHVFFSAHGLPEK